MHDQIEYKCLLNKQHVWFRTSPLFGGTSVSFSPICRGNSYIVHFNHNHVEHEMKDDRTSLKTFAFPSVGNIIRPAARNWQGRGPAVLGTHQTTNLRLETPARREYNEKEHR